MSALVDDLYSKGWSYAGTCDCTPKMNKYLNQKHPGFMIKIAQYSENIFSIFKNDARLVRANISEFQKEYQNHFK